MREDHSGYIIHIKRPTKPGYAACMAITPKRKDGVTDVAAKVQRDLGHAKAAEVAEKLLKKLGATADLLEQVRALGRRKSGSDGASE